MNNRITSVGNGIIFGGWLLENMYVVFSIAVQRGMRMSTGQYLNKLYTLIACPRKSEIDNFVSSVATPDLGRNLKSPQFQLPTYRVVFVATTPLQGCHDVFLKITVTYSPLSRVRLTFIHSIFHSPQALPPTTNYRLQTQHLTEGSENSSK